MSSATADRHGSWSALCAVALALATACSSVDPCRRGERRDAKEERCVAIGNVVIPRGEDAGEGREDTGNERGTEGPDEQDAGEAHVDLDGSGVVEPDADEPAGAEGDEDAYAPGDAAEPAAMSADADAGSQSPTTCEPASLSEFRRFQLSSAMLDAAIACGGSLATCLEPGCEIARCIREQAGVADCGACVEAEGRCVAQQCARECGPLGNGDACRACACYAGCFDGPGACGLHPVDICMECSRDSCTRFPDGLRGAWHPQEELATGNRAALQPVALSRALGAVETLWINDDGTLGYSHNDPAGQAVFGRAAPAFAAPEGVFLMNGSLAVAGWLGNRADIVARSSDDRLWHVTLEGSPAQHSWGNWSSPAEDVPLLPDDRLAIAARGPRFRDALFAGADGNIYRVTFVGATSLLENLGAPAGVHLRSPHLTARAIDLLDVVARGDDDRLYYRRMEGERWTAWSNPFGIVTTGAPQVVSGRPDIAHIYWHEALPEGGGHLKLCGWASTGWHPVVNVTRDQGVASLLEGNLSFVSLYPDRVDAVGRTNANGLVSFGFYGEGNVWWDGGMGLLNLGPHPVTALSARRDRLTFVFGTNRGTVGAVTWY